MTIAKHDALPAAVTTGATYRILVDLREASIRPLETVRLLLAADVVRRVVEDLCVGQAWLAVVARQANANSPLRNYARGMGVREPAAWVTSTDRAQVALAGPPAIVVASECQQLDATSTHPAVMRVGTVAAPPWTASSLLQDHEPAAIRLALLRFGPGDPASLSIARLRRAEETLQRWRSKVADWADMPSAPAPTIHLDALRNALMSGFDTAAALTLLHRVEIDHTVVSGSKFETFVYADRVLGLDLAHLVGRVRR
jgi:hypothetical protein